MVSHFAHNATPSPDLYSAITPPFGGYVTVQNTQNTPHPIPVPPFSWPELESGQNELQPGQQGPQQGNMFEKRTKLL